MSVAAYRKTMKSVSTPREIERLLLSKYCAALSQDQEAFDRADSKAEKNAILASSLRDVLYDNARLWRLFKADLSSEGNQLPAQLRARLISIAIFVERQTRAVLRGEGRVKVLIDVNQSIIAGLAATEAAG
jgi:flagellar protein FlaF